MRMRCFLSLLVIVLAACDTHKPADSGASGIDNSTSKNPTLVVYSSRNEHLIKPVFEAFTQETGIAIEYATDKAGVLIERIKAEKSNTAADILLTVDAGTLGYAAAQGIFQPLNSELIEAVVPAHLRDSNGFWTGLSLRARTLVYSTERVNKDTLSTYEALGNQDWQGRLCLRTSKKVYNQSLVAMLVSQYGVEKTQAIVESWVGNLAIDPTSNDTKLMQAIMAGQCDVGIVNSYYFGRLQKEDPALPLALYWPNQAEGELGVHINVAGAGVLKHSKQPELAKQFVEWLVSESAQQLFAGLNQEYPVNLNAESDAQVKSWGSFRASQFSLSEAYALQSTAVQLMDRARYR